MADFIKTNMKLNESSRNVDIEQKLDKIEKHLHEIERSRYPDFGSGFQGGTDDKIDLRELWNVLWSGKWIITTVTFVFAVASVVYALTLPDIYKSEALLAPAEENSGGGLAGMVGSLGGLASLAGVNIGGRSDKTMVTMEVLKSREFITSFIQRHNLLVPLMAAKGWDQKQDRLILDKDTYDNKNKKWVRKAKPPRLKEPSLQEAYKEFMKVFNVSKNKETNLVTLTIEYYSPSIAKSWVDFLIKDINAEMKLRDMLEAKKSIQYLTFQLEKTSIADMQAVFYELIEEQTKKEMFAEVRDEYVFKTIDKAIVAELKSRPKRALICILATMFGGVLAVMIVFIHHFVLPKKKRGLDRLRANRNG